jgi:hypothetical protein
MPMVDKVLRHGCDGGTAPSSISGVSCGCGTGSGLGVVESIGSFTRHTIAEARKKMKHALIFRVLRALVVKISVTLEKMLRMLRYGLLSAPSPVYLR